VWVSNMFMTFGPAAFTIEVECTSHVAVHGERK
jgi:hypothetical protein